MYSGEHLQNAVGTTNQSQWQVVGGASCGPSCRIMTGRMCARVAGDGTSSRLTQCALKRIQTIFPEHHLQAYERIFNVTLCCFADACTQTDVSALSSTIASVATGEQNHLELQEVARLGAQVLLELLHRFAGLQILICALMVEFTLWVDGLRQS